MPVALVAGSGPSPASEVQTLLRTRLRFLGLLGTGFCTQFTVLLVVSLVPGSSQAASGLGFLIARAICILVLFASLTGLLWSKRPLSLSQLRLIEIVTFGCALLEITTDRFVDLGQFGLTQVLKEGAPVAPPRYAAFYGLPFFVLIIAYGTLIPNTWRRASVVVGMMALIPFSLTMAAVISHGVLSRQVVNALLLPLAMTLSVCVALAVYGSHRIAVLRQESFTARRFGQYHLLSLLGTGGMGDVYLAEHALLRRPCVIKLIRSERADDPNCLRRFEREVQATAGLTNWHTVEIYDYGHATDGTFYYVMEYLPGLNLEQLVRQNGPLPIARVIHLLCQVCSALREAHAAGLIHRDIKPGNIITGERGGLPDVAKLLDFGLVRGKGIGPDELSLTLDGMIAGTPAYMSPEQAAGNDELDSRTDIYSLGAVAYFLLTGRPPFVRDTAMRVIAAHLCEPVTFPDRLRSDLPASLQAVILKCLEKDPAFRFPTADSLSEALSQCVCASGTEESRTAVADGPPEGR